MGLYILMLEFRQYRLHIAMHAPPYQMFLIPSCNDIITGKNP